jgi:hypothetical protein
VIHSLRQIRPATDGATHEAPVTKTSRPLMLAVIAHSLKAGLGVLFLYLGTTKLLGRDEAARLAAMGVDRYLRDTIGWLELTVAALLLVRASGYLLHSLVAGVALIEVGLLHRAPLAAFACLVAHGLSTWARSAHDRNRKSGSSYPTHRPRAVRARLARPDVDTVSRSAVVVHPKPSATDPHPVHPHSPPGPECRSHTNHVKLRWE